MLLIFRHLPYLQHSTRAKPKIDLIFVIIFNTEILIFLGLRKSVNVDDVGEQRKLHYQHESYGGLQRLSNAHKKYKKKTDFIIFYKKMGKKLFTKLIFKN